MLKPKNILLILASCLFAVSTIMTFGTAHDEKQTATTTTITEVSTTLYTGWQTQTSNVTTTTLESVTEPSSPITESVTTTTAPMTTTTTKSEPITTTTTTKSQPITTTTTPKTESIADEPREMEIVAIENYVPTQQEMMMFCTVVSSETGYCEDMAQKAVAHTIINRVLSSKYPNNIYDVVTQRNQYSCISNYFNDTYRKGLAPGTKGWEHTMQLCIEAIKENDFTNGAVAYYNPHMIGYSAWFEQYQLVYEDKYGRFFKV